MSRARYQIAGLLGSSALAGFIPRCESARATRDPATSIGPATYERRIEARPPSGFASTSQKGVRRRTISGVNPRGGFDFSFRRDGGIGKRVRLESGSTERTRGIETLSLRQFDFKGAYSELMQRTVNSKTQTRLAILEG